MDRSEHQGWPTTSEMTALSLPRCGASASVPSHSQRSDMLATPPLAPHRCPEPYDTRRPTTHNYPPHSTRRQISTRMRYAPHRYYSSAIDLSVSRRPRRGVSWAWIFFPVNCVVRRTFQSNKSPSIGVTACGRNTISGTRTVTPLRVMPYRRMTNSSVTAGERELNTRW